MKAVWKELAVGQHWHLFFTTQGTRAIGRASVKLKASGGLSVLVLLPDGGITQKDFEVDDWEAAKAWALAMARMGEDA